MGIPALNKGTIGICCTAARQQDRITLINWASESVLPFTPGSGRTICTGVLRITQITARVVFLTGFVLFLNFRLVTGKQTIS